MALARRLRGPGGCPWDAEQSHHSLTRYLLEEAYETVEVLEQLPGDAPAGEVDLDAYARVEDELGDLLFQVVFHSILATEAGVFDLGDVARGVHDKLVRRHPHVFGDVEADSASAVVANWEQIKKAERSSSSLVDSISPGLPSLLYAHKLYRKAASVGLEPDPGARRIRRRCATRWRDSRAGDGPVEAEVALGDLLAGAVVAARARGVDAESSLRGWAGRFRDRFVRMEQLAADARSGADAADAAGSRRHAVERRRGAGASMTSYEILGRTVTIPVEVRAGAVVVRVVRGAGRRPSPRSWPPRASRRRRCRAAGRCCRSPSSGTTTATSTRTTRSRWRSSSPTRRRRRGRVRTSTGCRSTRSSPARPGREIWGFPKFVTPIEINEELPRRPRVGSPSTVGWR